MSQLQQAHSSTSMHKPHDKDQQLRDIRYGKVEREEIMDGVGSKLIQSATIHDGRETDVKTRFEVRVKVNNEKELLTEFIRFRAQTKNMANATFRIEYTSTYETDGSFYAIKCWTEVRGQRVTI